MKHFSHILTLLVLTLIPTVAYSQTMTQNKFASNNQTINYWLYTPANPTQESPILVYLHGGSGKGDDLNILLNNGFPKFLHDGDLVNPNAYVIIPQVPSNITGWANLSTCVRDLVISVTDSYHLNKTKISITGHSMGGTGVWSIALRFPKLFTKIAPLSGSIKLTDENLATLSQSDIWAVVGSEDKIVDPQSSIDFIEALNKSGNNSRVSVIDGYTHFDVPNVYLDDNFGLTKWLLEYDASGINDIIIDATGTDEKYYDLHGRVINNPQHGIYIYKRKKVLIP